MPLNLKCIQQLLPSDNNAISDAKVICLMNDGNTG
jgi:hypothetical protein